MTELMLPSRAVVQIASPDARTWLQGLVTQDVTGPAPLYAGLLSPRASCCSTCTCTTTARAASWPMWPPIARQNWSSA
ncbi:hypothetical protein [Hankyongella ginsenosidimutans]|uniref:hypothetical protein n=1 Tax=Hankyongella ginsenosidimutans TaxID=1763828 RepID=UPI001CA35E4F|nr:hypothetical protein [Hankyongella ginsenosidimutans]